MDIKAIHELFLQCGSISIDTRKIEPNSMFVAIKGERFDANTFAEEAIAKGAKAVIIDNSDFYIDERTLLVEDSLQALQQLAQFHRDYLGLPIIALTGSNGKTTSKELIQTVLQRKFNARATVGNLNNHIGVPLTLLSFSEKTQIGIVEMGANHQKEIEFLCSLAEPDFGYITNFGKAHLEGFGGAEGVIKGKSELYDYLSANGRMAFVNLNDPIQAEKTRAINSFSFGVRNRNANVNFESITANPFVTVFFEDITISSHLIGLYNADNITAAITIGKYFGIDNSHIKEAIEGYVPQNNRSQLLNKGSNEIILDAYNANPSSMKVAIENFLQLDKKNKIAILGDMFELGKESPFEHKNIVDSVSGEKHAEFIFIGPDFYANKNESENLRFFESFEQLTNYISQYEINDSTILIKGSRGMALERTLELL
jgi:UDP-N-acetylmuramoyl-tripeptide--D-alanyl-D-alanine ligase